MSQEALLWILATLGCVVFEAIFSMAEMAAISYPRLRLSVQAASGVRAAQRLQHLLDRPARLFSTTLLGANLGIQLGAECGRQVYAALGWPADLAPLTQVPLVILFAELAPLFAARRSPESIAQRLSPILSLFAYLLRPFTALLSLLSSACNRWVGGSGNEAPIGLVRDELIRAFEETAPGDASRQMLIGNVLSLRERVASRVMYPFDARLLLSDRVSVKEARRALAQAPAPFLFLCADSGAVRGVLLPERLFSAADSVAVATLVATPLFVSASAPALAVARQLVQQQKVAAVVLNAAGQPMGWISVPGLIEGCIPPQTPSTTAWVERTVSGEMSLETFERLFGARLEGAGESLEELLTEIQGHPLGPGDLIPLAGYLFLVEEAPLVGACRICVKSVG